MSIPESNGKTVLITGINGYIAGVLGLLLLKKGYHVRGTTRRTASTDPLLSGPYAAYRERIEIHPVPDMTVDGAFDDAVKGVHGIFHTASPIDFSVDTYEGTVGTAVRGNETILASALKAGPQLSSVVVTSSVAAVTNNPPPKPDYVYTESDFASSALAIADKDKSEGKKTAPGLLYTASKTAAEKVLWKFRDEHKPSFAITAVNPSVVIGPPALLASSPSGLNETLRPVYSIFSGTASAIPPYIGSGGFVDVRDVAEIHVWAYEHSDIADGERYIACQGFGPTQAVADILREKYAGTKFEEKITKGEPGNAYEGFNKDSGKVEYVRWKKGSVQVDGSKAEKAAGIKYIDFPQSVIETAKALEPLL
ncbi:hypothetical protein F5884DRAFT_796833 [Xylogone sp. PMI_703]|nr:hypothetical protein F5884DRAFT_796833 [Xylogone sp. PMI_703]